MLPHSGCRPCRGSACSYRAHPGAQMASGLLHRWAERIAGAALTPCAFFVAPRIVEGGWDRGCGGGMLGGERERIGLVDGVAAHERADAVLVALPCAEPGDD